jgi:hypothetical protein
VRMVGDTAALLLPDDPPPGVVGSTAADADATLRIPLGVVARAIAGLTDGAVKDRALSLRSAGVDEPGASGTGADEEEDDDLRDD